MSARIDVTSARFHGGFGMISLLKKLPSCTQSESWQSLLDTSIDLVKVNASAGLSSLPTMSFVVFYHAFGIVEAAAKHQSQHGTLLDSGVADALEFGCLHDFTLAQISTSAAAAGAIVALLGRNEGGKTLSRDAVFSIVASTWMFFDQGSMYRWSAVARIVQDLSLIHI